MKNLYRFSGANIYYYILSYRVEKEINARKEAEKIVKSLRKDVDDATLARMDLERKVETLHEELELLRATTDEVCLFTI